MTDTERVRALRAAGMSLRQIAAHLSRTPGWVSSQIDRPRRRGRIGDTARSVVRHVPVVGCEGSMSCYFQPVSVPRVSILDGVAA